MSMRNGRDKIPCFNYPGGCPRRKPGCQDHCEEMIAAKAQNDARKQIEREKRYFDNAITQRVMQATGCKKRER